MRGSRLLFAGAALLSLAKAADAETMVRSGSHPGFGRIVVDSVGAMPFASEKSDDHFVVRLDPSVVLGSAPKLPHNVVSVQITGSVLDLGIKKGTSVKSWRMGERLVLDVIDAKDAQAKPFKVPVMASSPELSGRTVSAQAEPPVPMTAERPPVDATPLPVATATAATATAAAKPEIPKVQNVEPPAPGRDALPEVEGPVGLLARRSKLPKGVDGTAFLVPFDPTTAAAAFQSNRVAYIVFDERRPIDMAALRSDPLFAAASVQLLANGTLLRVPLPSGMSLALTQLPRGWRISVLASAVKQQPVVPSFADGHYTLAAEQPGDVVSLADPDTGATILVGTQRRPGQGVQTLRRGAEFVLRPTLQGVLAEPLSDAVTLKQIPTGFSLAGAPGGLAVSPAASTTDALIDATHLTRRLDFSTMRPEALIRRWSKQVADASSAPPQSRGQIHHAIAETLLALGLAVEAESFLHMAAEQDPKEAASADTGALTAIAAILAGRIQDADALTDPRLDGTDEIALWRAVRMAMRDQDSSGAAATFATTAPLALLYPKAIRDRILPLMAETMLKSGEVAPAARLMAQFKTEPKLAYARALQRQMEGDTEHALEMYDDLAKGHDQFDRVRAAAQSVELSLASGKLDKSHAADALDKLLYAWRGDARELALRERVAALRAESGAWRVALGVMRQAEADFPEQAAMLHERLRTLFGTMIKDPTMKQVAPVDFVAMLDENADLLPEATEEDPTGEVLVDRLLALDLPRRAKPVLEKLLRTSTDDAAKAKLGLSLGELEAREGNDIGAMAALNASEGAALPADLTERRTVLRAEVMGRGGALAQASALLGPFKGEHAVEARAQILENAGDWSGAQQAWTDLVRGKVPAEGALDEAQVRTLLRLATATARAGDEDGLAGLRHSYGDRIGSGPLADMFRLLTVEPVRAVSDIGRAKQEMSLAASLPGGLKALHATAAVR